jgi:hypothetical protein
LRIHADDSVVRRDVVGCLALSPESAHLSATTASRACRTGAGGLDGGALRQAGLFAAKSSDGPAISAIWRTAVEPPRAGRRSDLSGDRHGPPVGAFGKFRHRRTRGVGGADWLGPGNLPIDPASRRRRRRSRLNCWRLLDVV